MQDDARRDGSPGEVSNNDAFREGKASLFGRNGT
jgi:hypothetical protein